MAGLLPRKLKHTTVLRARRTDRISIASPGDFAAVSNVKGAFECASALPYCLDFPRRRAVYVCGIDIEALKTAPFYYLHLRRNARSLLSVPIEHGSLRGVEPAVDPVFVFSPGRCGSTLLSRLLSEAHIAAVSEPDFFTQMSSVFWSSRYNPVRKAFWRAMWSMTDDLCGALGAVPVIKLRAECCRAPGLFLRKPDAKAIVMLRSFESWARSTARVFAPSPGKAVSKYMRALRCYAYLRANGRCQVLRYDTLIAEPQVFSRGLGEFLDAPIPVEAVRRAMAADSQSGTPLEHRSHPGWQAKFDATMRLWHTPRLVGARARLGIPALWD